MVYHSKRSKFFFWFTSAFLLFAFYSILFILLSLLFWSSFTGLKIFFSCPLYNDSLYFCIYLNTFYRFSGIFFWSFFSFFFIFRFCPIVMWLFISKSHSSLLLFTMNDPKALLGSLLTQLKSFAILSFSFFTFLRTFWISFLLLVPVYSTFIELPSSYIFIVDYKSI